MRSLLTVLVVWLLGGCVAQPTPLPSEGSASASEPATSRPPLVDVTLRPNEAPVTLARTTESLTPRWGASPDGPLLLDDFGEHPEVFDAGTKVVVLGDAVPGPGGTWVPIWFVPNMERWPNDFFAW